MLLKKRRLLHCIIFFCFVLLGCGESVPLPSIQRLEAPKGFEVDDDIRCENKQCTVRLNWIMVPNIVYELHWVRAASATSNEDPRGNQVISNVASSYDHIRSPNRTIRYQLSASIDGVANSKWSDPITVSIPGPPVLPQGFTVTPGDQQITIDWIPVVGLTYKLSWSNVSGVFDNPENELVLQPPYVHSDLTNGLPYYYQLRAVDKSQQESLGALSSKVIPGPPNLLGAPQNLNAASLNGSVILTWSAPPSPSAISYKVYWLDEFQSDPKALKDKSIANNQVVDIDERRWSHQDLQNETTYYYVVTAIDELGGEGALSDITTAMPTADAETPPPSNVTAIAGDGVMIVQWESDLIDAVYDIYWSNDQDVTSSTGTKIANAVSGYTHEQLENGKTYYYIVTATINGNLSVDSSLTFDTPEVDKSPRPDPPTNFDVIAQDQQVIASWENVIGATRYNFYWSETNDFSLPTKSLTSVVTSPHSQDNLSNDVTYYFWLTAENDFGESDPTEVKPATPRSGETSVVNVLRGGRLYDQWWAENQTVGPTDDHPIWARRAQFVGTPVNTLAGKLTWACHTCHGWDYRGAQGVSSVTSPQYTGFKGLDEIAASLSLTDITAFIRSGSIGTGESHAFESYLSTEDINDLALFVKEQVYDLGYLWFETDIANGQAVYTADTVNKSGTACNASGCHEQSISNVIRMAVYNPDRFIHVVRFGMPEVGMPGGSDLADSKDVLAYVWQNLVIGDSASNFNEDAYNTQKALPAKGGLLYDRWWLPALSEPKSSHPLWFKRDTIISGLETWRCKECHGWDYRGSEGAYGEGNHFSGVAGPIIKTETFEPVYNDAKAIYDFLRNGNDSDGFHAYKTVLADEQLYQLTSFIEFIRSEASLGIAPHLLIDNKTGEPIMADVVQGELYFSGDSYAECGSSGCHSLTGKGIAFQDRDPDRDEIQYVDTIAKLNPWEFVHKTRFGHADRTGIMGGTIEHPNAEVVGSLSAAMDILAYSQTTLLPDVQRGGRLYASWWLEKGVNEPTDAHALWPTQNTLITGAQTWRCSACHGWDYKGVEGVFGDLNHDYYTGTAGIVLLTQNDVADFIRFGTVLNAEDHSFNAVLKNQDISALMAFITQPEVGVTDVDQAVLDGDSSIGDDLYHDQMPDPLNEKQLGNCVTCHGEEGTSVPNVDLATLVLQNPHRVLHAIRFGKPGSIMVPSVTGFTGLDVMQASHVLAYTKTLTQSGPGAIGYDTANAERGGRLYANWWREMQVSDATVIRPDRVNPFWDRRDNITIVDLPSIEDTWRCVTCHGTDYRGIDFTLKSHDADNLIIRFDNLTLEFIDDETGLQQYIFNFISNGSKGEHNFGESTELPTVLGERELWDLSRFVIEQILDTSNYIRATTGEVYSFDQSNGQLLYGGSKTSSVNCQSCHGEEGKTVPPGSVVSTLDIFTIADQDPWRFLHAIRFGLSNTDMPAIVGIGELLTKDAVDITGFAQQSYNKRLSVP